MSRSLLEDAFRHHVWASVRLIDSCLALSPDQLEIGVPGTYGSILDTVRHLVGSDSWYLFCMTDERTPRIDEEHMDLRELRAAMEADGAAWSSLLAQDLDPDAVVVRRRDDGSETHAPFGIRLAQALHHGTDHRSQICTALTSLGVASHRRLGLRPAGRPRRRGPANILTVTRSQHDADAAGSSRAGMPSGG